MKPNARNNAVGPQLHVSPDERKRSAVLPRLFFFLLCVLSGFVVATQYFAYDLSYHPSLGGNVAHVYFPWAIILWAIDYQSQFPAVVMRAASFGMMMTIVLMFVMAVVILFRSRRATAQEFLHGSARWADPVHIARAGLDADSKHAVIVGAYRDKNGQFRYLRDGGPSHVLCMAPTRSGKGVGLVVPTLLSWGGSTFNTDLKGELWALTAGWRQAHAKNKVLRFEPALPEGGVAWNPLDEIREEEIRKDIGRLAGTDLKGEASPSRDATAQTVSVHFNIGDVQNISTLIVDPDGKGLETHWQKTAFALLVGVILHAKYRALHGARPATLPEIDRLLSDPDRPISDLWSEMCRYPHIDGTPLRDVARTGHDMLATSDAEARAAVTVLRACLKKCRDLEENPLDEIREDDGPADTVMFDREAAAEAARTIVALDDQGGAATRKTALTLLTALILHVKYRALHGGNAATPAEIDRLLSHKARPLSALWRELTVYPHLNGKSLEAIVQSARDMLDRPEEEAGSVLSTAKSYLNLYRDPVIAENVSRCDFHVRDLMHHDDPVSLYVVTQPVDKDRLRPLVRILVNMTVRILADGLTFVDGRPVASYKHRLLLMMDEFPSLKKLDIVQESLAFLAGYGIKAYIIVQDLGQLRSRDAYGHDEAITSNCHVQAAFPTSRLETAEHISKFTGITTIVKPQITESGQRGALLLANVTKTYQEQQRALLTPDEVMRLPGPVKDEHGLIVSPGHMVVFAAGYPAIYGEQPLYFKDPVFAARAAVPAPAESDRVAIR